VHQGGRLFSISPDAQAGDYLELLAEMGCLVAVSGCPGRLSGTAGRCLEIRIFDVSK
jgi:uncharacterized protein YcgI (DUF1989 family)